VGHRRIFDGHGLVLFKLSTFRKLDLSVKNVGSSSATNVVIRSRRHVLEIIATRKAPRSLSCCALGSYCRNFEVDRRRGVATNEVRWRRGQEASLAPPCSILRSFGSKFTVCEESTCDIVGTFRRLMVIWRPGNCFPLTPLVTPLDRRLLLPLNLNLEAGLMWKMTSSELYHVVSLNYLCFLTTNRLSFRIDCSARSVIKNCFYFCSVHVQQLSHWIIYTAGGPLTLCSLIGPHA